MIGGTQNPLMWIAASLLCFDPIVAFGRMASPGCDAGQHTVDAPVEQYSRCYARNVGVADYTLFTPKDLGGGLVAQHIVRPMCPIRDEHVWFELDHVPALLVSDCKTGKSHVITKTPWELGFDTQLGLSKLWKAEVYIGPLVKMPEARTLSGILLEAQEAGLWTFSLDAKRIGQPDLRPLCGCTLYYPETLETDQ